MLLSTQSAANGKAEGDGGVELVVFDMGHVFIDFSFEAVCQNFCTHAGVTLDDLKPVLKRLSKLGYEIGIVTTAEFLHHLNTELRTLTPKLPEDWRDLSLAEFHEMWNYNFSENVEMAALLGELKGTHRLALLSNTNESHFESLESKFKVTRHFDEVYLSYVLGLQKPDLKIYEHVVQATAVHANRIVFIDDRPENVEAARKVGINAIQFQNPTQLRDELRKLGLIT
jgi:epoxide hydrolase-like predicted phosphatase